MPRLNNLPIVLNIVQQCRFWSRVSGTSNVTGCWLWSGPVNDSGYGHFKTRTGALKAHRVAWTLKRGQIPSGMTLDHLCRTRLCVNPAHLEIVTNAENILRGESPTALNKQKTRCPRGHDFTPENTHVSVMHAGRPNERRWRVCMLCERERWKRSRARRRLKAAG
jgi:hypothetical protein